MGIIYAITLFVFGLIIGSFSNVIIHRLPKNESIVSPGSKCPKCDHKIKWYDNVPLISYLFLGGKCRNCHTRISLRYPLVEGLMGLLYLFSYQWIGLGVPLIFTILFITIGIILIFIDLDYLIIPDVFVISILGVGIANLIYIWINQGGEKVFSYLLGMVFGFFLLLLVRVAGYAYYKREALGLGDVKLMGASGLFLGLEKILLTILVASIIGAVVESILIALKFKKKDTEIPFGPYLIIGLFISLFFGKVIIDWYIGFFWELM